MTIYRPRVHAELNFPNENGEDVIVPLLVKEFGLCRNDHNSADTLNISSDSLAFGQSSLDPRIFQNTIIVLWIGQADSSDNWQPENKDKQFIGRVSKLSRSFSESEGSIIEFECIDYTSYFLLAKPFPANAVPDFSQTLDDAWRTICENTPGAEDLAENIVLQGISKFPVLGDVVADRFKQAGKIVINPGDTSWKVWQQIIGSLGLISFFRLDQCIVTTSTDLYAEKDTPLFVLGQDVMSFKEERNNDFEKRGIGVTSFNPLTNTTLEAVYPPIGDILVQPKHTLKPPVKAKKHSKKTSSAPKIKKDQEERDYFVCPGGTTDLDGLQKLAQRIYEERSRQEFRGSIKTVEMKATTIDGSKFDILTMDQGETIKLILDDIDFLTQSNSFRDKTQQQKIDEFKKLGFDAEFSKQLAENIDRISDLRAEFYVREIKIDYESNETGGKFEVELSYCNKINFDGNTNKVEKWLIDALMPQMNKR